MFDSLAQFGDGVAFPEETYIQHSPRLDTDARRTQVCKTNASRSSLMISIHVCNGGGGYTAPCDSEATIQSNYSGPQGYAAPSG